MNDNYQQHYGRRGNEIQQRLTYRDFNIVNFGNQQKHAPSIYQEPVKSDQKLNRCLSVNNKTFYQNIIQEKPQNLQKPQNYEQIKMQISQNPKNLINIQSTKYDFINNKERVNSNTYRENITKKDFTRLQTISRIVDDNRIFNPNYRPEVISNTQNQQYHKKNGECNQICEMQKGYGVKQTFRKYK